MAHNGRKGAASQGRQYKNPPDPVWYSHTTAERETLRTKDHSYSGMVFRDTDTSGQGMTHVDKWLKLYESSNIALQKRALRGLLGHFDELSVALVIDVFDTLFVGTYSTDLDMLTRELRRSVIAAMKRSNNQRFVEPLLPYVSHTDPNTRGSACDVLGALNDKRATPILLQRLTDPVPHVRRSAGFALASICDLQSADAIQQQYLRSADEDVNVMIALETALRALGVSFTQHPWPKSSADNIQAS